PGGRQPGSLFVALATSDAFVPAIVFVGLCALGLLQGRGGPCQSEFVLPAESRRGRTIMGRELSPSCTTFVPKSTRFSSITLRSPQCSPAWRLFVVNGSTGSPAEATTDPAALSSKTDFTSPVLTRSLSADSMRS